jgi:hypothetical protein
VSDHARYGAELSARITAARAAAGSYQAEVARFTNGGPAPHWDDWAARLASQLQMLLDELDDPDLSGVAQRGGGWLSGASITPGRWESGQ